MTRIFFIKSSKKRVMAKLCVKVNSGVLPSYKNNFANLANKALLNKN